MKRYILLLFTVCFMLVASCKMSADSPKNAQSGNSLASTVPKAVELTPDNEHVIKVFEGEYSEEKYNKAYKEAIESYQYYCEPIEVDDWQSVVFTVNEEAEHIGVDIASVYENDIEKELSSAYDSVVWTTLTGNIAAVRTEWWDSKDDEPVVIGYRVGTWDKNGENEHWYYFRVKYINKANKEPWVKLEVPEDFDYSTWKIRIDDKIYCATEEYGELLDSSRFWPIMDTCESGVTPTLNGFVNFGKASNSYFVAEDGRLQIGTPDGVYRWFELCE